MHAHTRVHTCTVSSALFALASLSLPFSSQRIHWNPSFSWPLSLHVHTHTHTDTSVQPKSSNACPSRDGKLLWRRRRHGSLCRRFPLWPTFVCLCVCVRLPVCPSPLSSLSLPLIACSPLLSPLLSLALTPCAPALFSRFPFCCCCCCY